MLDGDVGRVVELLDDRDLAVLLHDPCDRGVLVPAHDCEPARMGPDGFVLAARQVDPLGAPEAAALADELDAELVAFAPDVEALGDVLDALLADLEARAREFRASWLTGSSDRAAGTSSGSRDAARSATRAGSSRASR